MCCSEISRRPTFCVGLGPHVAQRCEGRTMLVGRSTRPPIDPFPFRAGPGGDTRDRAPLPAVPYGVTVRRLLLAPIAMRPVVPIAAAAPHGAWAACCV